LLSVKLLPAVYIFCMISGTTSGEKDLFQHLCKMGRMMVGPGLQQGGSPTLCRRGEERGGNGRKGEGRGETEMGGGDQARGETTGTHPCPVELGFRNKMTIINLNL
jgi:hypothetical protein